MFANHLNQLVHLVTPEYPKVFTNFEDQVGEYSIAYKKAKEDFVILKKIVKNSYNYDLIVQYKDSGIYDIIHYHAGVNTTESYGYKLDDCIPDKGLGDTVKKNEFIYKSTNYDSDGNFGYGVNLKAIYGCWYGKTYEDGVVLSESAAKKLKSFKVENTMFSINTNDILLNLYGDDKTYKSFPRVGDHVDGNILVAMRRKNKYSILYDFQTSNLSKIDPTNDKVIYTCGGTISDITIYSNVPMDVLEAREDEFNKELLDVLKNQRRYWQEMAEALEEIIPLREMSSREERVEKDNYGYTLYHPILKENNPNKYTDELAYYWKLAHENIHDKILWRHDAKVFDNMKIEFQIIKENPLVAGSKISGRYGNKGIVSEIVPDDQMPMTEDGTVRAEVLLNALGIINRNNLSQIQEQHINFMSDHVIKLMKEKKKTKEQIDLLLEYVSALTPEEGNQMKAFLKDASAEEQDEFIQEIFEYGIPIHQSPFFDNTSFEQFRQIMIDHPEWCTKYKFKGIEKELVAGDLYFIRLKHEPQNKSSMRSATNLNTKNLPAKSTLKRERESLYSSNPLRLGEMEVNNLLLAKDGKMVEKLLKTYSTNQQAREETIENLLLPGTDEYGLKRDPFNMDLKVHLNQSISRNMLEKYLNLLEFGIIDTEENEDV